MAATLVITLGPPTDEKQKELFDAYQESITDNQENNWAHFEKELVAKIFKYDGENLSIIEKLYSDAFKSSTYFNDYFFAMGKYRGLWVANVSISQSDALREKGSDITWPYPTEVNNTVAAMLGYTLKREWVRIYYISF